MEDYLVCDSCGLAKPDVYERPCGYSIEMTGCSEEEALEVVCDDCESNHIQDI